MFESTVLALQSNLTLDVILTPLGKSISLSDKPVNPHNSCEICIALFPLFYHIYHYTSPLG